MSGIESDSLNISWTNKWMNPSFYLLFIDTCGKKNKESFTQGWQGGTQKQLTSYENTFTIYNLSRHVPRLQLVLEKNIWIIAKNLKWGGMGVYSWMETGKEELCKKVPGLIWNGIAKTNDCLDASINILKQLYSLEKQSDFNINLQNFPMGWGICFSLWWTIHGLLSLWTFLTSSQTGWKARSKANA